MVDLRSKVDELFRETRELEELKEYLTQSAETQISDDPTKSKEMSRPLKIWLDQVEDLIQSLQKAQDKVSFNCFGCACSPYYIDPANVAMELHRRVEQFIETGKGFNDKLLVRDLSHSKVKFIPMYFDVVGQEDELKRALQLIEDDDDSVGLVGICGEAGVGKTTLLKRINNYFYGKENAGSFDFVIFLIAGGVDQNFCIQRMQKDIGERMGLFSLSENGDEVGQARQIVKYLGSKNFVLLLDGVLEKIDLDRIGIPPPNSCAGKKHKVVISTRDKTVLCSYPVGRIVEMGLLSFEESRELFGLNVNDDELLEGNEEIRRLAKEMAKQCRGLPSVLYSVGKSMASAKMDYEWRNAKRKLTGYLKDIQNSSSAWFDSHPYTFEWWSFPTEDESLEGQEEELETTEVATQIDEDVSLHSKDPVMEPLEVPEEELETMEVSMKRDKNVSLYYKAPVMEEMESLKVQEKELETTEVATQINEDVSLYSKAPVVEEMEPLENKEEELKTTEVAAQSDEDESLDDEDPVMEALEIQEVELEKKEVATQSDEHVSHYSSPPVMEEMELYKDVRSAFISRSVAAIKRRLRREKHYPALASTSEAAPKHEKRREKPYKAIKTAFTSSSKAAPKHEKRREKPCKAIKAAFTSMSEAAPRHKKRREKPYKAIKAVFTSRSKASSKRSKRQGTGRKAFSRKKQLRSRDESNPRKDHSFLRSGSIHRSLQRYSRFFFIPC